MTFNIITEVMKENNNVRKYILSQRPSYLALGAVVGFFIGLNEKPINYYMIVGFVLLAVVMSWLIGRRK